MAAEQQKLEAKILHSNCLQERAYDYLHSITTTTPDPFDDPPPPYTSHEEGSNLSFFHCKYKLDK